MATVEFPCCHEVLKVFMVCPDLKLVMSTFQEMMPVFQGMDNYQHPLVMDLIVAFHSI